MEIKPKILQAMADPEKLIDPRHIVNIRIELAEIVDALKGDIFNKKLEVSQRLVDIRKEASSATLAKAELELDPVWREYNDLVRLKERLNGFRADLRDKLQLITGNKY